MASHARLHACRVAQLVDLETRALAPLPFFLSLSVSSLILCRRLSASAMANERSSPPPLASFSSSTLTRHPLLAPSQAPPSPLPLPRCRAQLCPPWTPTKPKLEPPMHEHAALPLRLAMARAEPSRGRAVATRFRAARPRRPSRPAASPPLVYAQPSRMHMWPALHTPHRAEPRAPSGAHGTVPAPRHSSPSTAVSPAEFGEVQCLLCSNHDQGLRATIRRKGGSYLQCYRLI